ncbi:hypothetical protein [Cellulomonas sp. SG140]|uniref:hypothetical protein n=1 Tax=Cellulomonas sp. SG140 TaxID=2976536 RepID=UPI0021E6E4BA|nr:hypothetical protein [Cellulomonas sp. SG140]
MSRRAVLGWVGAGALVVVGGTLVRAQRQGLLDPRTGPAYTAWQPTHRTGAEAVVAAAVLAASPHNLQNWWFRPTAAADGSVTLDVHDDTSRSLGVVDAHRREAHLGIGAAVANAEVAAPALGFDTRLTVRPAADDETLLARLVLTPRTPADPDPLAQAIWHRHSDRGAYPPEEPSADLLGRLRATALDGSTGVDLVWITTPDQRQRLGTLLVDAATALTADHQMSVDNAELIRYDHQQVERYGDGLTIDAQALSPFLEVAAQLLPATSRTQGDNSWVRSTRDVHTATARAYGLVVGDRSDPATRVHAGRVLQRLHLALVAEGWAMQHMNQAVEMAERDAALGTADRFDGPLTQLAGGQVIAALRMGRPSGRAVASPRRPLADVLR